MAYNRRYRNNKNSKKRLSKKDWRNIVITIVVALLTFGVISGVATLFDSETKTVHPLFIVGGIDETTGEHLETDGSIYTRDSFDCEGLAVELDFDAHVTYQVFYYDELDNFISASSVYEKGAELDIPENAVAARIVVTPVWAELNVEEDEQVIEWYDVAKYANQLKITTTITNESDTTTKDTEADTQ